MPTSLADLIINTRTSMPARGRRSPALEDPRIKRQELARGVYNFKDVWSYYKKLGWKAKAGGELGYDHFYIKPSKNVKHDKEGEDFFYGEAAIVEYGMKERIFGDVPPRSQQPAYRPLNPMRAAARSTTKSESVSDFAGTSDYDDEDGASESSSVKRRLSTRNRESQSRRQHQRGRIKQQKQQRKKRPGSHALDAISITSGSGGESGSERSGGTMSFETSDDDGSDADFHVDDEEEEEEVEFEEDADDEEDFSSADSEEEGNADDVVVVTAGPLASGLKGDFRAKKQAPRPLLRTKRKRSNTENKNIKLEMKSKRSAKKVKAATTVESEQVKSEHTFSVRPSQVLPTASSPSFATLGKSKRKPAGPRRLSTENVPPTERNDPVPHAEGTRALSTQAQVSPPVVTASTQGSQSFADPNVESTPPDFDNPSFDPDPREYENPSLESPPAAAVVDVSPKVHMHLEEVVFPSQPGQTFCIKITSTETPKQTRIWIENIQTREQRECAFSDIRQLDDKGSHEIPEKALFEALLRSLRSSKSSTADSAESQREKFSTEEPGKVDLLRVESGAVCLQLLFPCYEFWQQKHRFMMKLVPTAARLNSLTRELDEAKKELVSTQRALATYKTKNQLLETECEQLRVLLRVCREKEHSRKRFAELHQQQQQQAHRGLGAQETKMSAPVQPAQVSSPKKPHSARRRDARSFHARSGWIVSSRAASTLQFNEEKRISWESIVEAAEKYFRILDQTNQVVKILQTGTYQINLNVAHENSLGLVVLVKRCGDSETTRKLEPTLVQFYDNKQRVSRLDQVVELNADDQVSVHLAELRAQRDRICWLEHFVPQPNILLLTFLDQELVYKEAQRKRKCTT